MDLSLFTKSELQCVAEWCSATYIKIISVNLFASLTAISSISISILTISALK